MAKHERNKDALDPQNVGYVGRVWDETPNEHYTVAGRLADKPVPETQPLVEGELPPLARHQGEGPVDEGAAKAEAEEKARQEAGANRASLAPQVGREPVDSE